jgi:hypothetical protein
MFYFPFYESLEGGFGVAGGGNTFAGAGIDGNETMFGGGELFLFDTSAQWNLL